MIRMYSKSTGSTYIKGLHEEIPGDAVEISEDLYQQVIASPPLGKLRGHSASSLPILIDPPAHVPTVAELCQRIDTTADSSRLAVAGDPLRALEYERAAEQAASFKAAGYPAGQVPAMVAAWAINGRTAQQAADGILQEAEQYNSALAQLRTVRLAAKEQVRALMAEGKPDQAKAVAEQAVAAIQAAVAGVGNARG